MAYYELLNVLALFFLGVAHVLFPGENWFLRGCYREDGHKCRS